MLERILHARYMVKHEMKSLGKGDGDDVLKRVLDCRQLAIKNLANVTYGFTAASFSGRMPMSELADAIVSTGRALLEWSRRYIETAYPDVVDAEGRCVSRGAKVVYGDTDSLFVHLPGQSKVPTNPCYPFILPPPLSVTPSCYYSNPMLSSRI